MFAADLSNIFHQGTSRRHPPLTERIYLLMHPVLQCCLYLSQSKLVRYKYHPRGLPCSTYINTLMFAANLSNMFHQGPDPPP